ncbi:NF038122 family metalloprotease [Chamaesiphon sp. GL140_3_metabinner_50]|uniref:NF038122 family metalloprotease n=1 Tax=Chamaesiphon sp. GL140_3_metabinner_50 TaxID=2970812 RepID=UPI0025F8827C|nr:NF038122 family metalloprotease [Chamaesiphon sp. GL140_3_metabinner_50]
MKIHVANIDSAKPFAQRLPSQRFRQRSSIVIAATLGAVMASSAFMPANALTFNFTPAAGTSQLAIDGFNTAGSLWSAVLKDNVTVNVNINFTSLSAGTLGETSSATRSFGYDRVYNALTNDRTSADDNTAVNSLSKGSTFNLLLNRTANNPNGSGSATPYLDSNGDANNKTINLTTANAKALGLAENGSSADASIAFSNLFTWDFDRNNGITTGAYDFVGIAAHEIGHALGFTSGVDILDGNSSGTFYNDNQFPYVSPLDLFRYSSDSKNANAIDWTADKRSKYFSIDGGATKIAEFSTGDIFGDGRQNGHWKDNLGLGILDPTISPGELLAISENDKRALDVIGWNRVVSNAIASNSVTSTDSTSANIARADVDPTSVPEPANLLGTFIFTVVGIKIVLKRRQLLLHSAQTVAIEEV